MINNPGVSAFAPKAGDVLEYYSDGDDAGGGAAYTKEKEFRLPRAGIYRVTFNIKPGTADLAYAKIYKNGVAYGIERSSIDNVAGDTFSEDLAFVAGDLCQLYAKKGDSTSYHTTLFRANVNQSVQGERTEGVA